jgi:hypothetical protein
MDAASVTIVAPMPAPASLLFRLMRYLAFIVDRFAESLIGGSGSDGLWALGSGLAVFPDTGVAH